MKNFIFLNIILAIKLNSAVIAMAEVPVQETCKKAGGIIKAVSSTCDFSCGYFEELKTARLEGHGLLCTRDAVETCVCPVGKCFENGICKNIPSKPQAAPKKLT